MLRPSDLILIAFFAWIIKSLAETYTDKKGEVFQIKFLKFNLRELKEWMESIIVAAILAFVIVTYVARTFLIPSTSMVPTLKVGDVILVDKITPKLTGIKRGDIVVFHPPIPNETRFFVKRVIGLPGDIVEVHDGKVFINGIPLNEPYVKEPPRYDYGPVEVPKDQYFLLGDNRNNSFDSHAWDYPFVSRKLIEGRVIMIIFPIRRMRIIHRPKYNLSFLPALVSYSC